MTDHTNTPNVDEQAIDLEQAPEQLPLQDQDGIHEIDIDGDGDLEPISESDPVELAQAYIDESFGEDASGWRVEEVSGNADFGMVTVVLGRYEESEGAETQVETAEGHGTDIAAAVDAALGRTGPV